MILIVEDIPELAAVFVEALANAGYPSEVAPTAQAAIERLERGDVELALVDLGLPDFNGAELARYARARGNAVPMIVVTGAKGTVDAAELEAAGFVAEFDKPVRLSALIAAVETHRLKRDAAP